MEAGEEVGAQAVAPAPMAVGLFEDAKDLQATDDVLDAHPLTGQGEVVRARLGREWNGFASALEGRAAPGVELGQALVARVGEDFRVVMGLPAAALEEAEVVLAALTASDGQDHARGFIHHELAL